VTRQETSRVSILLEEDPTVHQDEEDDPDSVDETEICQVTTVTDEDLETTFDKLKRG
jgi:hypothetical protein